MKEVKLTRTEQEKLFEAVILYERGYWKSYSDSVLMAFGEIIASPFVVLRYGKTPAEMRHMEEAIRIKETYKRMKREFLLLKKRKLIIVDNRQGRVLAKLSNKGFLRLAKRMMRDEVKKLPDDQKLLVTFDIPESAHRSRRAFRYFLKGSKFKMLQKSVWMTDRDVREPLMLIMRELRIDEWVSVVIGNILKT